MTSSTLRVTCRTPVSLSASRQPTASTSAYTPLSAVFNLLTPRSAVLKSPNQTEQSAKGYGDDDALQTLLAADGEDEDAALTPCTVEAPTAVLPYLTIRAACLGAILCSFASILSTILHFKLAAPPLSPLLPALIAVPIGKQPARRKWGGSKPWVLQEAVIVSSMAGAGTIYPYAADIVVELTVLYRRPTSMSSSLLLILTSQLVGLCVAVPFEQFLVRPSHLIWPTNLPLISLLKTLHAPAVSKSNHTRLFITFAIGIFMYQFLPNVFFPLLSGISIICLGSSNHLSSFSNRRTAVALGSSYRGFGIGSLSLDWSTIAITGPLYVPLAPALSLFAGVAMWVWMVSPYLWLTDFWGSRKFPKAVGAGLFDRDMQPLRIEDIINVADLSLNETALAAREPISLNPNFALSYAWGFAALASAVVSVIIWQGKDIVRTMFRRNEPIDTVDQKRCEMRGAIPRNWTLSVFGICFILTTCLGLFVPIHIPLWAVFSAIGLGIIFVIPCGVIAGMSGTTLSLNIISELICGVLHPGRAAGNMVFKTLCQTTMTQALRMSADLKLCLDTKTPARSVFVARLVGALISAFTSFMTISYILNTKLNFLDGSEESVQWSGRQSKLFGAASVTFGLLGPTRFFSGHYKNLYYGFVIGAIAPVIGWIASKIWPKSGWQKVCWPLIALGAGSIPEWPSNLLMGLVVTLIAQWWAPTYAPKWYKKSRLIVSAALDAGTALNALVTFMCDLSSIAPIWWGNTRGDFEHCAL